MDTLSISIDCRERLLQLHALYALKRSTISYTVVPSRGTDDHWKALKLYFKVSIAF